MDLSEKKICQSCGMPMLKKSDFGTNKDNSLNNEYCHYCFKRGTFTDSGITLEEKIRKNIALAEKTGMSGEEASKLAHSTIPKLKRWKIS